MTIIDARVRLPQDRRATKTYQAPSRQTEQYDRVLGLTDKMNSGTLHGLLAVMEEQGISQAVMHAESEGGEDADALNERLRRVVDEHRTRFVGIGCVDIGNPSPNAIVAQAVRAQQLGLLGVSFQPAFFGLDIDDRRLYPLYAR
ncbi:MAG: amidohydrolase, partial [Chloroflexi bacterium]|nr:amidohydrolase [Chloroflexota bacterium]